MPCFIVYSQPTNKLWKTMTNPPPGIPEKGEDKHHKRMDIEAMIQANGKTMASPSKPGWPEDPLSQNEMLNGEAGGTTRRSNTRSHAGGTQPGGTPQYPDPPHPTSLTPNLALRTPLERQCCKFDEDMDKVPEATARASTDEKMWSSALPQRGLAQKSSCHPEVKASHTSERTGLAHCVGNLDC